MFVRWKRRNAARGMSLDALIVENTREGKKVKQRTLCYLGVVHESTAHELRDRFLFWKYTAPKMDRLNLTKAQRGQLEAQLSEVIPAISKRECDEYERAATKRLRHLTERINTARRSA